MKSFGCTVSDVGPAYLPPTRYHSMYCVVGAKKYFSHDEALFRCVFLYLVSLVKCRSTSTAKHRQVKTETFSPHSRYVPTYGLSQTGLCNEVRPKIRSIQYRKLHPKSNSEFYLGLKKLKLDATYFCPNLVAKSSSGKSIRNYAP